VNLHGIVTGAINTINPPVLLSIQVNTGPTTNPDGTRAPTYAPPQTCTGQIQPLQYTDIIQMESLILQGERRKIYINGNVDGLVRVENKGGDLITDSDGNVWLVAFVSEDWPDWCAVAVTLQDQVNPPPLWSFTTS